MKKEPINRELLDRFSRSTLRFLIVSASLGRSSKIPIWEKYGLSCDPRHFMEFLPDGNDLEARKIFLPFNVDPNIINSVRAHWLVVWYLENNPSVLVEYKPDQTGQLRYLDVLSLAEKESEIHVHYNDFIE